MSTARPAAVVVLAAGEGTRMKSAIPKVLHEIAGRSLLGHAMHTARAVDPQHLVVVVRHGRDRVAPHVAEVDPNAVVADQDDIPGTGRAVQCGLDALPEPLEGTVVVTYGDVPLLQPDTLTDLVTTHERDGNAVTVVTAEVADPTGYGRVVRGPGGDVLAIVEQKDADESQRAIREINSGIYAFDAATLTEALKKVGTDNAQGEMYLTDVLALARDAGGRVAAHTIDDVWQTEGVNDRVQLARMGAELNRRLLEQHMRNGVTVIDPSTTWVDVLVELGRDVTLQPSTQLQGETRIADGATVGPDTTLRDVVVGEGAHVVRTHGSGARIGAGANVGPFSYLRPGTVLGQDGKIGAFVETKNAQIGNGSKVPHLSYVGDADIGEGSNIGAATVVVNYDGVAKHHTTIGSHVRVGSDSMLVAPITIGDGAYTAAGSVIVNDVPPGAMAVARGRQRNVEGWVQRRRAGTPAALAAERALRAQQSDDQQDQDQQGEQQDPSEGEHTE
ncbi:MAG TPA: bifunctional UDP-N-acetylglucosamine diphosphorylase/glucosamine-1-phosphate N-acetyltransferase GlmU [Actinomycetales bacterium]|nr:bifunctional UDP-N-acetylglucosamine diphosphorylase/glucosamine-1-phosphate N-acetyltransferase GlmU [Actinomycetales bacterium]